MITKENIKHYYSQQYKEKTIDIYLDDNRFFQIIRDFSKYDTECTDYDKLSFDCMCSDEFTEKEKEDLTNLYHNGEFDEWLEW